MHTPAHADAVAFYTAVLDWSLTFAADTDEFRYALVDNAEGGEGGVAGLMDNRNDFAPGVPAHWTVYFESADVAADVSRATDLGATIEVPAMDTPYGVLAALIDPSGGRFSLRKTPIY